jgi:hypothetical protein
MTSARLSSYFLNSVLSLLFSVSLCPKLHAQALLASSPLPDAPTPFVEATSPVTTTPSRLNPEHKFWDKQNRALLIAAAALNGADFAVTRANLQSGGQELNPVVRMFGRSNAGLAVNFVGETVGVISLTYFFHKTGHHKLERAVSLVNIGSSAGAVSFGLLHR